MQEHIYNNKLIFDIDPDGDNYDSFEFCRKFITRTFFIDELKYNPGFFDDAAFHFTFNCIRFKLECSGLMGTELWCALPLSQKEIESARKLAEEVILQLKEK